MEDKYKEVKKRNYSARLCCSRETKKMLLNECVQEFLSHHKDLEGMYITHDFILRKLIEYYLKH